jgi:nucleoid DNA-binding protein
MTKSQLIDAVHEKNTGLTKLQVAEVVDAMIEAMKAALAQGGKVEIRGFGNFTVRQRKTRRARNPRTGEIHFIRNLDETKAWNVFVMMRYQPKDYYKKIELSIRSTLSNHGLFARLAKDSMKSVDLWSNVKYYMDNCSLGIAVFEQIDQRDYNPNVSIEVGYMRAQKKPCLLLKEKRLQALPTDLCGSLYKEFDIMNIEVSVQEAVSAWINDIGKSIFAHNIFLILMQNAFSLRDDEIIKVAQEANNVDQFVIGFSSHPKIDLNSDVGHAFRTFLQMEKIKKAAADAFEKLKCRS